LTYLPLLTSGDTTSLMAQAGAGDLTYGLGAWIEQALRAYTQAIRAASAR